MVKETMISLIIPIYNTKPYLRRCLESIVAQDYTNIEVIMINDGSTDNPEKIINYYVDKYKNFICINQMNKGVSAARNVGVIRATGEYISFVDSDDLLFPDYCSYLLNIIGDADIAIAGREKYVGGKYIKSKTASDIMTVPSVEAIRYMLIGKYNTRPAWGKLYKREIVEKISFVEKHVFEEIRYSIDSMVRSKKVVFADKDLYSYRIRSGSIMTTNEERQIKDITLALEYIYQTLIDEGLYSCCEEEFKIWLTGVIIYNTKLFIRNNTDLRLFKESLGKLLDLFDKLVPNGRALFYSTA